MKAIYILFFLSIEGVAFSRDLLTIPFECIDNRIILKIQTIKNESLNFIFDTGTHGILLDLSVTEHYNLVNKTSIDHNIPFINGLNVPGKVIVNNGIFTDSILDVIYTRGYSISLNKLPNKPSIPIQGIMGMSEIFEHYIVLINFEKHCLSILEFMPLFSPLRSTYSIPMIYTDKNFETNFSSFAHGLPASSMNVYFSDTNAIEINGLFDTGFRDSFLLLTSLQIDSIARKLNKNSEYEIKYDSSFQEESKVYTFNIDSLIVGGYIHERKIKIHAALTSSSGIASFGSSRFCALIGVSYLRKFKQIYFNYPGRRVYFND